MILLEINRDPLFNAKVNQVVADVGIGLLLIEFLAFTLQIVRLAAVLHEERIENSRGNVQILSIRFDELL